MKKENLPLLTRADQCVVFTTLVKSDATSNYRSHLSKSTASLKSHRVFANSLVCPQRINFTLRTSNWGSALQELFFWGLLFFCILGHNLVVFVPSVSSRDHPFRKVTALESVCGIRILNLFLPPASCRNTFLTPIEESIFLYHLTFCFQ